MEKFIIKVATATGESAKLFCTMYVSPRAVRVLTVHVPIKYELTTKRGNWSNDACIIDVDTKYNSYKNADGVKVITNTKKGYAVTVRLNPMLGFNGDIHNPNFKTFGTIAKDVFTTLCSIK